LEGGQVKRNWAEEELVERWTLFSDELALVGAKTGHTRLGFAVMLRFFAGEGHFPRDKHEVPAQVLRFVGEQVGGSTEGWMRYDWGGRAIKYHRAQIREFFGFREATAEDGEEIASWLLEEVLPREQEDVKLREVFHERCRALKIEPPTPGRMGRLISSATRRFEARFCASVFGRLPDDALLKMDALLATGRYSDGAGLEDSEMVSARHSARHPTRRSVLAWVKADAGQASLDAVLDEVKKLGRVREVALPPDLFAGDPPALVKEYRRRAAAEVANELRAHQTETRATLMAALLWWREREITDGLLDLLVRVVHKIGARAEKRVGKELLEDLKKVTGKTNLLFRMAEAAVENPEGTVREVLYPVVGEQTLKELVKEYKGSGPAFRLNVHARLSSSYRGHYRRMLAPLLERLEFRSNNAAHRPVIEALEILRRYAGSTAKTYPADEVVPIQGVVPPGWTFLIVTSDDRGRERVDRVGYEVCALKALRETLRRREIWVVGADRYRDPDEDLPKDFDERREDYYADLGQPLEADRFVDGLKAEMEEALQGLDAGIPKNDMVRISERSGGRISVSPLKPRPEPPNLDALKAEVGKRWPTTGLLDVFKEADLRVGFTDLFVTSASRGALDRDTLRRRLLLALYGLGTNAGLKRMAGSDTVATERELRWIRLKFVSREHLRAAIAGVANATFAIRRPEIWGEATTSCASDSTKVGAWDQNLMTEWHVRYGGRGVMIYWHVEKKSVCLYSQLKSASSSEVAAMIEGVLRHCTDMTIEKNYTDSHGQSEIAFCFSRLLGFELMPRLKAIDKQKLYLPGRGAAERYPNLRPVLTRPIDWGLIRREYDRMVRYAAALKSGTADAESILRRFSRGAPGDAGSPMHPTYRALAELGKAVKTVFLCSYLRSEQTRREIHEGLNTIERWNATNSFVFFGKGGEISTNRLEEQEVSVLSLHLLQICLVYVNTLMIQRVLAESDWSSRMTHQDLSALTPLIFHHINPYGTFDLDMDERIPIETEVA
jgi:TnpA family transposase